jgi:DNA-binding LytR/AlgR family response regulator
MEPALADRPVPDPDHDLDRDPDRAPSPGIGPRLNRITTAGWVWAFTVYSFAMTTACAAWFARQAARANGESLEVATSLLWQGASYALWLPVAGVVWLLIRRFGAGLGALTALTVAGLVIVPLTAAGAVFVDLAFGSGAATEAGGRTLARIPVSILLYTAISAVGAAAAHRDRAAEAHSRARMLELALAVARRTGSGADASSERLMVMTGKRRAPVRLDEVEWFAAAGNYVVVHWADREGLIRETLKALETRLDGRVFARSHRATVVNLARVRETRSLSDGSWKLTMASGAELIASRTYRDAVLARLGRQDSSVS